MTEAAIQASANAAQQIAMSRTQRLKNAIGMYAPKAWSVGKMFIPYGVYKAGKKTKKKVKQLHAKYKTMREQWKNG